MEEKGGESRIIRVLKERVKGNRKGAVGGAVREGPFLGWAVRGTDFEGDR